MTPLTCVVTQISVAHSLTVTLCTLDQRRSHSLVARAQPVMGLVYSGGSARLNTRAAAKCRYNPAAQPRSFSAPCGSGGRGKSANRRTPHPGPDCDPQPLPLSQPWPQATRQAAATHVIHVCAGLCCPVPKKLQNKQYR